ncbi:MAG: acyltransferase [Acidimicrobiales bacterium]
MTTDPTGPKLVPRRTLGHVPALDGLRGIAVAAVIVNHLPILVPSLGLEYSGGFLGVDLFFALSGFLITAILLREISGTGRVAFGGFFRRRAARLLPALAVFGVAFFVYGTISGLDDGQLRSNLLAIALYYFNWQVAADFFGIVKGLGHLWSLSVEEQFYLVWPFVVAALSRLLPRRPQIVVALLLLGVVAIWMQRLRLLEGGDSPLLLYVRTDTRADSLLLGAAVAYLWVHGLQGGNRWLRVAGPAAATCIGFCMVVADVTARWLYQWGFTAIGAAAGCLILYVVECPARPVEQVLGWAPLRLLGRVSYGTYIWHLPVMYGVDRYGSQWPVGVRLAVATVVTASVVTLSWRYVEQPILRRSRR